MLVMLLVSGDISELIGYFSFLRLKSCCKGVDQWGLGGGGGFGTLHVIFNQVSTSIFVSTPSCCIGLARHSIFPWANHHSLPLGDSLVSFADVACSYGPSPKLPSYGVTQIEPIMLHYELLTQQIVTDTLRNTAQSMGALFPKNWLSISGRGTSRNL